MGVSVREVYTMRKLILALLLAAPAFGATPIQAWGSAQDSKTGSTPPVATLTSCATHNAYFIVAYVTDNSNSAASVTMSSTNIPSGNWHHGANIVPNTNSESAVWWAYSASVADSEAVTATGANVFYASITAQCYSGVKAASPNEAAVSNICSTGSPNISSCNPGSVSPTQGGELIIAAMYSAATATVNAGFTLSIASNARSMAYLIQTTPSAASPTFSFANGGYQCGAHLLSFLANDPPLDYSASGPSSGFNYNPSTNFTVTKATGTFNGSTTISISDGAQGGTVTPSVGSPGTTPLTVTPTNGSSSFTFTYTPTQAAALTLTFSGAGMNGENPLPLGYTSNPTILTNSCVSGTGVLNAASSTCTLAISSGPNFDGTRSVTITDSGEYFGGTFTPSVGSPAVSSVTVTPPSGSSFTYTYTPTGTVGARIISVTNGFQGTNPANIAYSATSGDVCTMTAKATGNWNAAETWTPSGCTGGGHATPVTGDTVSIGAYTVTCSTGTCLAGTAPANNTTYGITIASGGSLVVASGATLVLTGNYKLNSNTGNNAATLNIQTGGTFLHDNNNSASVAYRGVGGTSNDWNALKMGTSGDNSCAPTASYTYSCPTSYAGINVAGGANPQLFAMNGLSGVVSYQIYGASIKNCGSATLPCLDIATGSTANGYANAGVVDVENSVFDTTSVLGSNAGAGSTTKLTWIGNREVNDIKGFLGIDGSTWLSTSNSCVMTGNFFDTEVGSTGNDQFGGCLMTWNFFSHSFNAAQSQGNAWGSFSHNIHINGYQGGTLLAQDQKYYVPSVGNLFYYDCPTCNSTKHPGPSAPNGTFTWYLIGNLCATNTTAVIEGHCGMGEVSHVASPASVYILDNLSVMSANGANTGSWFENFLPDAAGGGLVNYMDHNGHNGSGAAQGWGPLTGHGTTYYPTNAVYQTYRANIGWSPSSGSKNFQLVDLNQAASGAGSNPGTMTNGSTVIDWNDSYNGTASTLFATGVDSNCTPQGSNPYYGTVYQICATSGGPGAHETTANPNYIDTTRTPDTWAYIVKGQANSIAGVRAGVWSCASIPSCIGNMYAWIQRGWQPTNIGLKGAAHDGKIIGFSGTYGSGYSGACGVTFTPQDARDLGGIIPAYAATATCTFVGGVPSITITNGGAHYRIATPATVAITCGGCTPTVPASLTPVIQPSDLGPVPVVILPGVAY